MSSLELALITSASAFAVFGTAGHILSTAAQFAAVDRFMERVAHTTELPPQHAYHVLPAHPPRR